MKQRKFTTLTIRRGGTVYKKSVAYRTASELAEKQAAFEKECLRKEKPHFADIADQWQEEHFPTVEYYTTKSYEAPLKDLLAEFGDAEIGEIAALDVQAFLDRMSAQGYAQQTIKLRKIVMSQVMDWAVLHGHVPYNIVYACKIPKAKKGIRLPPDESEIRKIHAAPPSMWKNYYMLLMYSGLRREEALALTKADLDFKNCTVRVDKVLVFESNAPVVRQYTKTAAGTRYAPFPKALHSYFRDTSQGLIFAVDGKPINKGQFDKGTAKFRRETGITCTSHQLRHYFATLCHNVIDAKDAQHLLGHAKVSTTLDIYTNLDRRQKQLALSRINDHVERLLHDLTLEEKHKENTLGGKTA